MTRSRARIRAVLSPTLVCRCGHSREAHTHYRAGDDCSLCSCLIFQPRPDIHRP